MKVITFGGLLFSLDSKDIYPTFGKSMREIIAFLIYNGNHPTDPDFLSELVWPGKSTAIARSALNTSIWRLNSELKKLALEKDICLTRCGNYISLDFTHEKISKDFETLTNRVHELEKFKTLNQNIPPSKILELTWSLNEYRGDFLPELSGDWVLIARERLRALYIRGCQIALEYYADKNRYDLAINYGKKILREDSFRENTQRQVIWLHVMNGQRAIADQMYNDLKTILRKELDVEPMDETKALLKLIHQTVQPADSEAMCETPANGQIGASGLTSRRAVFKELLMAAE